MKGLIALVFLILTVIAFIASNWKFDSDARRHWRAASLVFSAGFAFSLVWAVWR